ncbi:hypothetical protein KKG83_08085 [Candidatus Micrarchaeota archaeon]|nr:hypothetical protein [Candidatus Micrarchaeota archaeon]
MAEIRKEKGRVFLELNEKDKKELNTEKSFFELNKVKDFFVLTEAEKVSFGQPALFFSKEKGGEDERIFSLLSEKGKKSLSMKVEGEFEKQLNTKEKQRFEELLKQGLIEKFKLNESYKKAIYRIAQSKKEKKKDFDFNSADKSIEARGFEVMVNDNQARDFCEQFNPEIKEGLIKGIKGFDGYFYVIHSDVLEKTKPAILAKLKENKTLSLNELKEKTLLPPELIRGTMEFLKEDGEVIEKRKGIYRLIE